MSGDNDSNITEQMKAIDTILDAYENLSGLPVAQAPCDKNEIQTYLTMNRDHIEKLTGADCSQIAYRLSQFSFYIQRLYNREQARIAWAQANLNDIIGRSASSFDKYTKHEVKVALIKQKDIYANKLSQVVLRAEERTQRLTFIATSLKNLSDVMLANQRSKK